MIGYVLALMVVGLILCGASQIARSRDEAAMKAIDGQAAIREEQAAAVEMSKQAERDAEAAQLEALQFISESEQLAKYGCVLRDTYDYPFNTVSIDWQSEELDGFYYHQMPEEIYESGGAFPAAVAAYTYMTCKRYGVDYEIVCALLEVESGLRWDAVGDGGASVGYAQLNQTYCIERAEKLGCDDLLDPYQNILVCVDLLAELQEMTDSPLDMLAAYNYGYSGASKWLWSNDVHAYEYNVRILVRAYEMTQETEAARARYAALSAEG